VKLYGAVLGSHQDQESRACILVVLIEKNEFHRVILSCSMFSDML
jgi:hypothetical protein